MMLLFQMKRNEMKWDEMRWTVRRCGGDIIQGANENMFEM